MKHRLIHTRLLCLLLCLISFLTLALPVYAKPVPHSYADAAPVYYRASSSSTVIGYMAQGTELTVLSHQGQYFQIDCYDMIGFIPDDFVEEQDKKYYVNLQAAHADARFFLVHPFANAIALRRQLYSNALSQIGVPYVSGGTSPRGFDCSGFTQYVYGQLGITIPRTCDGQLGAGLIIPKEKLQRGDLVLFQRTTAHRGITTHVGIYLGDGKLIHAGSRGITVVELDSAYFAQHYLCARRILVSEQPRFAVPCAASSVYADINTRNSDS